jgi:hypothetical protein
MERESFITEYLEGMPCPQCGAEESFEIEAPSIFTVYDDGTESFRRCVSRRRRAAAGVLKADGGQ